MTGDFVQTIQEDTLTLKTCVIHIDGQKGDLKGATRVYLWQIHVDVWQNQYNIVK